MVSKYCEPNRAKHQMYETTNEDYGTNWQGGEMFFPSFTQHQPYKALQFRRQVPDWQMPKDTEGMAFVHNPQHPCGIQSLSNVPMNSRGLWTNVRRDLFSDRQGLWQNSAYNTRAATIDRAKGTYSNLQGAWGRIGPSTYDAVHGKGPWVDAWNVIEHVPSSVRSLRDHVNTNPRHCSLPLLCQPQNQATYVQCMAPPHCP